MEWRSRCVGLVGVFSLFILVDVTFGMSRYEKKKLSEKVREMFNHAYHSYMDHAYPADELMPLSCKGRYRGTSPSRGDIDDSLGNFSLTLVDALDSLVVMGELEEFDKAVRYVIRDVQFDSDIVVSVFETNIRMLGGLLGAHSMAIYLKKKRLGMAWYNDELLEKAKDLGYRLLPAFNTTTGMPFPRVNLRHGVKLGPARTGHERDTCTACAGTMILEFAALSRFSGETIFEEKARKAMQFLWQQRHRSSDLVGKVINIHNGDWVHRESGVGAGIDSYYEYLIKAYILLGDETYLDRFNVHYDAIMKYIWQGPILVDVHMHKPLTNSRNFMDSLLAFWPGVQILKGDLKPAIEMHEMLYQVMQRHNFLPEAFTTDFRVHWGQHPLRPEFIESTYFIYKATGDPYYLEVGRQVVENLEKHARVDCGYAAIKDVTLGTHEDQMDSFFLAETFKYLFLLFAEDDDVLINVDDYVFTTEAHLLPLSLSIYSSHFNITQAAAEAAAKMQDEDEDESDRSCPNTHLQFPDVINFANNIRLPLKNMVDSICPKPRTNNRRSRLKAAEFVAGNKNQIDELKRMGIKIVTMKDGRVQLLHTAAEAASPEDAEDGMMFMQEMIELAKQQQTEGGGQADPRVVQLLSPPFLGNEIIHAGPAQFGYDLKNNPGIEGTLITASPIQACQPPTNAADLFGKIVIVERGDCMFIHKARHIQAAGAKGGIVIDHNDGTSSETVAMFSMSGDGKDDISIPLVFIFRAEGLKLLEHLEENPSLQVYISRHGKPSTTVLRDLLARREADREKERKQQEKSGHALPEEDPTLVSESTKTEDVKEEEEGSPEPREADRLLHQYLDKLKIGSHKINLKETKLPWSKDAETLLKIIEGPNNNRQVSLQLKNLMLDDVDRRIADVYTDLLGLLGKHTNFDDLPDQNIYMRALGALVETVMSNGERGLTEETVDTIERLAEELKEPESILKEPPSYITEEDVQSMSGPEEPDIKVIREESSGDEIYIVSECSPNNPDDNKNANHPSLIQESEDCEHFSADSSNSVDSSDSTNSPVDSTNSADSVESSDSSNSVDSVNSVDSESARTLDDSNTEKNLRTSPQWDADAISSSDSNPNEQEELTSDDKEELSAIEHPDL